MYFQIYNIWRSKMCENAIEEGCKVNYTVLRLFYNMGSGITSIQDRLNKLRIHVVTTKAIKITT